MLRTFSIKMNALKISHEWNSTQKKTARKTFASNISWAVHQSQLKIG